MAAAAIARPALLVAGFALAALALRLLPAHRAELTAAGEDAGTFVLLAALACAVGSPRQAVAFGGGYAFGFWLGAGLAWFATLVACAANFFWARSIARDWARQRLGARLAQADRFVATHPFSATLALRLLPVGNNLAVNLAAGLSAVAPAPFLTASALGYLPQTAIFALMGQGLHVTRMLQVAAGAALFAVSGAIGAVLVRRWRRLAALLSADAAARSGGAIPPA